MKTIYILSILFIISGCSSKNAFSNFELSKAQELSLQSFKRVKLISNDQVVGTFSSIYLNEVYPQRFNQSEYFLIYVYMKDSEVDYKFKLNSKQLLKIKELEHYNRFTPLTRESSKWSRYYLVSFEQQGNSLNLELHSGSSKLSTINYKKSEY